MVRNQLPAQVVPNANNPKSQKSNLYFPLRLNQTSKLGSKHCRSISSMGRSHSRRTWFPARSFQFTWSSGSRGIRRAYCAVYRGIELSNARGRIRVSMGGPPSWPRHGELGVLGNRPRVSTGKLRLRIARCVTRSLTPLVSEPLSPSVPFSIVVRAAEFQRTLALIFSRCSSGYMGSSFLRRRWRNRSRGTRR